MGTTDLDRAHRQTMAAAFAYEERTALQNYRATRAEYVRRLKTDMDVSPEDLRKALEHFAKVAKLTDARDPNERSNLAVFNFSLGAGGAIQMVQQVAPTSAPHGAGLPPMPHPTTSALEAPLEAPLEAVVQVVDPLPPLQTSDVASDLASLLASARPVPT